jgi:hypothetical protein
MARAVVLLKLTREGAMSIEQARAIYEETKIFFAQTGYVDDLRPPEASQSEGPQLDYP